MEVAALRVAVPRAARAPWAIWVTGRRPTRAAGAARMIGSARMARPARSARRSTWAAGAIWVTGRGPAGAAGAARMIGSVRMARPPGSARPTGIAGCVRGVEVSGCRPGVVTAWSRRLRSGSGIRQTGAHSQRGRAECSGDRSPRDNLL
ncbi:hypothetical protein A5764_16640 [Mycobacterium sp. 852002-51057_SCH5723018]|nr:hypothetical protein A5764_16640 [Mycobacterium sp. 852002-51057_SCH5723018]